MPQIVTIGSGGDYSTVASWVASSDYSTDWGVGNKATGQITGQIPETATINTAVTPNGALLTAFPGEEYDSTNSATCAGLVSSGTPLTLRDNGLEVSFIFLDTTGASIALRPGSFEGIDADIHDIGVKSGLSSNAATGIETYSGAAFTGNLERVVVEGAGGRGVWLRNLCTGTIDHLTIVDAGANGSAFRYGLENDNAANVVTNILVLMHASATAVGFNGTFPAGADFNAGSNGSAPGANSLDNRTTADLVNYAGGDLRTASGSALATAGSGGGFIGAFLESGGAAIEVTPNSINSVSTSNNPIIAFNSVVNVSPLSIDSSSAALNPSVIFNNVLNVAPQSIDSVSASNNPVISFSSLLQISPQSIDSLSVSIDPIVAFTSALNINPQSIDSLSIAVNPTIEYKSIINVLPQSVDSLSLSLNPLITTGQVQQIGNVTASFKDSGISVKYEDNKVSVGYKPSAITVNFK